MIFYLKTYFKSFLYFLVLVLFVNSVNAQWTSSYAPHYRHVRSVQMLDYNTIILVGGNEYNDEISSIFRSVNGGETWNVISDEFQPWLISVKTTNITDAVAVGWNGSVKKTVDRGETWQDVSLPENIANRSYNSILFVDENLGFAAGGNRINDSIQTIIKTTDGGNSWSLVYEDLGYWLKSIFFVNQNIGYAVGENGVVLKTLDGGNMWNKVDLPSSISQRNFNDVYFVDENIGWIVGGNKSNDSNSTIAKTANGGADWEILIDQLGGELNKIEFASPSLMLTVGDKSKIFRSSDGGNSFTEYVIPLEYDDYYDLYSLHFLNNHVGVIVGEWGIVYKYFNSDSDDLPLAPSVETLNVDLLSSTSVMLRAKVNSQNSETNISFEYGISESLGNVIDANPHVLDQDNEVIATAELSDLETGIYYYRVKANNSGGQNYGEIKQFYVGENPIPNFNFEEWTEYTIDLPQSFLASGLISKVPSYDGGFAVKIEDDLHLISDDNAFVANGIFEDAFLGGHPFAARPDSLIFYANYQVEEGTEAVAVVIFKKNGELIEEVESVVEDLLNIFIITGSSNGEFERLSFPINYISDLVPDTILIGFSNNSFFDETPKAGSNFLILDNISFYGTDENILNSSFEVWKESIEISIADSWQSNLFYDSPLAFYNSVVSSHSTDAQNGEYAMKFRRGYYESDYMDPEDVSEESHSFLYTIPNSVHEPAFSVYAKHQSFNGYYKFFPSVETSLFDIGVFMFKDGIQIGDGIANITEEQNEYAEFTVSINYFVENAMPDSASIFFALKGDTATYALIDNLSFDGFNLPVGIEGYKPEKVDNVKIYPNPANDYFVLDFSNAQTVKAVQVYNINGQLINVSVIQNQFDNMFMYSTADLHKGVYIIKIVFYDNSVSVKKLIVN